jgi:hypothetical protein
MRPFAVARDESRLTLKYELQFLGLESRNCNVFLLYIYLYMD